MSQAILPVSRPTAPTRSSRARLVAAREFSCNACCWDICATNSPAHAQIQLIDPKAGIDFPWLRSMPHAGGELITERGRAIQALEALVAEMERRNRLLAEAGVTNLPAYNRKVGSDEQLARMWLFHDELADWMMIHEYRDAVELNANRLGVKARAAGINLVFCHAEARQGRPADAASSQPDQSPRTEGR